MLRFLVTFFFMLGLVNAGALAQECDKLAVEFNSTPAPPYKSSAMRDSLAVEDAAPRDAPVMLFGDSQMARWPQRKLDDLFGSRMTVNLGVSGDRTQNSLWRLERLEAEKYSPKFVIVSNGANNLGDNEPACAIALGMTALVERVHTAWPSAKIIVLKTLPRGEDFRGGELSRQGIYAGFSPAVKVDVTVLDVDYVITCNGLSQFPKEYYEAKWRNGRAPSPCKFYEDDLIHISEDGYDLIGPKILDVIRSFGGL